MAISAYLSTQETTNASRTHRLILGPCTDELRDVLHHFVPPQTFPHVIKQKLDRLPCLTGPRKDLILPRSGSCTGNSTNMDICLLYILLRNIRNISPHSKGWSNDPDPNDCSPSACIETIRLARNQCVYSSIFSLSNTEFSHIWSNVRTAVVNLDTFLNNGCKNVKGFDFLRYETMDPVCDQHYHEELRKQVEEDLKTREMVTNLKREHGKFEENAKKGGEVEKNVEKLNEVFQVKQEPEWDLEISVDNSPCQETETQTSRGEKKHQLETDLVLDLTKKQRVVLYTLFLCQDGWDATIIDDCVGDIDVTKIVKELENKGQVYSGIPSYHKLISCDKKSEIIKSYRENCPLSDIDKNFFIQVASDKYIEIDDDVYCCHLDGSTKSEDIDPITTMRPIMEGRKRKLFSSITGLCWILLEVILLGLLDCGCNEQIHWFDLIDPSLSSDHNQEGCLESRRQKKCVHCKHCCHSNSSTKDDNYDSHTDNRNHRCNCRICMNSLLRFTEVSLYKVVGFTKPHAAAIKISLKSSEHYDVLSHFCDVDISLICLGGIGGIVPPFPLLWMSKASTFIERYDEQVLNPLSQTSEISILERYRLSILECHRLSILDCFEQNDIMYKEGVNINLYRLSLLHSCFLQIMKEVEHNSSRDPMPWPFIQLFNTFYLSSICSILIASILGKLMTKVYVKESKNGNAISPILKYCMRKEEVRHYVKQFFLEQEVPSSNCLNERGIKPGSKASNMNKHDDSNNGVDEHNVNDFHEIFTRIEIRPVEILAYPATQQPVLEPILNKFSVPERAPSKHDTMAVEFLRLCTMHDYPNTNGPSLLRLAQAGFFYEGNGNELVCFSCDFRKGSWNYNDSPREIHLRMSPNCKFLSQGGDGNVPVPRGESTQDLVPLQSAPPVVEPDSPQAGYIASTSNNTAHLASANYSDGQDQPDTTRRTMVVKHPEYASRPARLASYANFPRHMKQHPADMTDAGFYYAGFGDCCRCYHCGIGLRNWDPEDNPWIEHARWSMECPYILKIKGQAFIDLVQEAARAAEMAQDDEDSEAEGACNGNESDSGNGEKSGASNSSPSGGPAANEIENNVAKTSEATMSKGTSDDSGFGSGSAPVAQPIKAPLRTAAAQSLIHDEKIKPKYVTAAIEDLVKAEGWGAFTKENIRKYLKIHEENRKSASSASNADPNTLKQENKELKDLTICKICLDEKVSIVFLPCGHLVSCPQCAPALTKCPICRKNIKGTVRTNLVEKSTAK